MNPQVQSRRAILILLTLLNEAIVITEALAHNFLSLLECDFIKAFNDISYPVEYPMTENQ